MVDKMKLYKAVKWEAQEYYTEHGFTMVELWKVIKAEEAVNKEFWKLMALEDYEYDHTPHSWQRNIRTIVARKLSKKFSDTMASIIYDRYMAGGR